LIKNGIKSAHLDGTSSEKEREHVKQQFESKKIQVICSCDVLRESWDSDSIDGAIILRPCLSPAIYMQIIGRPLHGKEIVD
jgi:superfamily II DNA or RNA helicase